MNIIHVDSWSEFVSISYQFSIIYFDGVVLGLWFGLWLRLGVVLGLGLDLSLLCFRRTLLPSASSGYPIGRLSFTQLLTSVIGIPISSYHFGTSSSHRFRGLPLGRFPTGWLTSALLWGAVGAILLTCDHHLILFLFYLLFARLVA